MSDLAHKLTEEELTALEKRIEREYERAAKEVEKRAKAFFDEIKPEGDKLVKAMTDAPDDATYRAAKRKYQQFLRDKTLMDKRFVDMQAKIAADLSKFNQSTAAEIGERMNGVFAANHNFAAYALENGLGLNLQFTLYDERTVERLLRDQPRLLPKPKIDVPADIRWNQQKISSEITQGILTGEPIDAIADRLQAVTDMNRTSAIRNARTAMTGAQNAGRLESYEYAKSIGIKLQKEWLATLDGHTRDEHRILDGQKVDIDEPFTVGGAEIMYPGDPNAPGYLVYGCRCDLIAAVDGVDELEPAYRRDNISGELIEDMSYDEWESARSKSGSNDDEYNSTTISGQYKDTPAMNEYDYFSKDQTDFRRESISDYTGASKEDVDRYLEALCGKSEYYRGIGNNVPRGWFYGADGEIRSASSGAMYEKAKTIDEFIERSPKFEGEIFRGLSLDDGIISSFRVGGVISETGNLSSWTSSMEVAEMFAQARSDELGLSRVIFVSENPAHGIPAAHLSIFGSEENEVLVSNMRSGDYTITDIKTDGATTIIRMILKV